MGSAWVKLDQTDVVNAPRPFHICIIFGLDIRNDRQPTFENSLRRPSKQVFHDRLVTGPSALAYATVRCGRLLMLLYLATEG